MKILLAETDDIKKFMKSETFLRFDKEVEEYRQRVQKEHLDSLHNDTQRKIFLDWCNGICVCSEEYINKNNISSEDDYEAHSAILSVVSLGLG